MKKFIALSAALLLFVGCGPNSKAPQQINNPEPTQATEDSVLGLGDSYICSEFEATLGVAIEWYDTDERTYFKVPIHIKNIGADQNYYNSLYNTWYDPTGNQIQMYSTLIDDDLQGMGGMLKDDEADYYLYVPYSEDGTYTLITNDFTNKYKFEIEVKK